MQMFPHLHSEQTLCSVVILCGREILVTDTTFRVSAGTPVLISLMANPRRMS